MQGYNKWEYEHYLPLDEKYKVNAPYLCRIIPSNDSVTIETQSRCLGDVVHYKIRQGGQWQKETIINMPYKITGLKCGCEYEIYVENTKGKKSNTRIFLTGDIIGNAVNYLHPHDSQYGFSGRFLCSPSVVRLPSGGLMVSMDVFDFGKSQNLTLLFRSDNNGVEWEFVTELFPCFWGKLFVWNGSLYMLSVSTEYGDLMIGKSDDEGRTWSSPTVIARGGGVTGRGCHRAPCAVLNANGKLYTSLEYGSWHINGISSAVVSINEKADLMKAENWTISNFWKEDGIDAIEGSLVQAPDGSILNVLRYRSNKAIVLKLSESGEALEYIENIELPLAHTKFEIQKHTNGKYYAVGNEPPQRNVLSLYESDDLKKWKFVKHIVNCSDCDMLNTGFQYPSFLLDNNRIIVASRTAYNGADDYHNSNYITLHISDLGME